MIVKPKKTMVIRYPRLPPPEAKYLTWQILKMPGGEEGPTGFYTEASDIQGLVEKWVIGFKRNPPNQKDVERFSKWLLSRMDGNNTGDVGMEKAVGVMKWWVFLLRRNWGWREGVEEFDLDRGESDEGEKDGAHYERKQKGRRSAGLGGLLSWQSRRRWTHTAGNGSEGVFRYVEAEEWYT